jgi:hypothetical protein
MLIDGFKFFTSCQSQCFRQSINEIVQKEYESVSMIVKNCLHGNQTSAIDAPAKGAFSDLERILIMIYIQNHYQQDYVDVSSVNI